MGFGESRGESMVQLANFENFRPQSEKVVVKLEVEDPLEEEHGPLNKKAKRAEDGGIVHPQPAQCSLLDEPSPLGLRLRKSPSLLDLIQMRLSQGNSVTPSDGGFEAGKKELKTTAMPGATDKLKASNFPASLLRIGSWECVSRYEGDLVAKCYYAKHKIVWEVLDGGLKSKIEIQWSDIMALQATCAENAPGTLDIVLVRQPLFFRETNPQPRKHTLWQATSDFTNGQASIHRRHFLQCPPGLLSKHFEKLIQCDPRLNSLSRQSDIILESPYFEPRSLVFEDHDESKCHGFDDQKDGFGSTMSGFRDHVSICVTPSTYTKNETWIPIGRLPDNVPQETLSPSSVIDARVIEENPTTSGTKELLNKPKPSDQIKVPGLRSSMSMSDLVNHIGHCISGQTTPDNPLIPTDSSLNKSAFEELTQYLLGDSQVNSASDEQSLMSRVNSLCCLIQHKNPTADDNEDDDDASDNDGQEVEMKPSMSRKESYGELLMHLPRIASMPFLFNITEDSENQAR